MPFTILSSPFGFIENSFEFIQYNVMLNRTRITQIPEAQWSDVTKTTSDTNTANDRFNKLQQETAAQAAERILQAIISGNSNQANEASSITRTYFLYCPIK